MKAPVRNFVIRDAAGAREAETLVIGGGLRLATTAGGLPELSGATDDVVLSPSGGDDAPAINAALRRHQRIRLAPGKFTLGTRVDVPRGRTLAGSGMRRTVLRVTQTAEPAVRVSAATVPGDPWLSTSCVSLEGMTITLGVTPTSWPGTQDGVVVESSTSWWQLSFRDLYISGFNRHGLSISNSYQVEITRVDVDVTGRDGIALENVQQASLRSVTVVATEDNLIRLSNSARVDCAELYLEDPSDAGILVHSCKEVRLACAELMLARVGIQVEMSERVIVEGLQLSECPTGIRLDDSWSCRVDSCLVSDFSVGAAYLVRGGGYHAISACAADQSTNTSVVQTPHVRVGRTSATAPGAVGVTVTGFRKTNAAVGAPTIEADVADAGGRVVFIQHNLDSARINSGGNFAAL
ncbi:MAG: right-handed parallel beta-helix repeat-containing protein [Gemmatimonadota bacterium]